MSSGVLMITGQMHNNTLPRVQSGRLLMGVCSRLADRLGFSVWGIRALAVVAFILTLGLPVALGYLMYANYINYKDIEADFYFKDSSQD